MYRIIFIIIMVLAIGLGLLVGTLNSDSANVDLLFIQLEWPLGLLILSSSAAGLFLGLILAWFFSILPLRSQLRRSRNRGASSAPDPLKNSND